MIRLAILAAAVALALPPITAQAMEGDQRIVTIAFQQGKTIALRTAVGNGLSIVFAPGESIVSVAVSDPAAFDVVVARNADSLLVRTLRSPTNPQIAVHTQLRDYAFTLAVGLPNDVNYAVNFDYAPRHRAEPKYSSDQANATTGQYRLSGEKTLRPMRIDDDGEHTYLEWASDQLLPGVFAINALGSEEVVDGYMRAGVFTIDRVNRTLVFRIDRKSAKAERIVGKDG